MLPTTGVELLHIVASVCRPVDGLSDPRSRETIGGTMQRGGSRENQRVADSVWRRIVGDPSAVTRPTHWCQAR